MNAIRAMVGVFDLLVAFGVIVCSGKQNRAQKSFCCLVGLVLMISVWLIWN